MAAAASVDMGMVPPTSPVPPFLLTQQLTCAVHSTHAVHMVASIPWLAGEQLWSKLGRMFLILLAQVGQKPLSPFEVFDHRHMSCLLD